MAISKLEGLDNAIVKPAAAPQPVAFGIVQSESKEAQPVHKSELEAAVKRFNELVAQSNTAVEFFLDEATGKPVIKVIDTETQSVLRQLPNEEALAFSRNLDKLQGLIVRQKV